MRTASRTGTGRRADRRFDLEPGSAGSRSASKYRGKTMRELTLEAKVGNLKQVLAFVDEFLEQLGCSLQYQMRLDVVVEELYVNIASYAYPESSGKATIRIEAEGQPPVVSITLIDNGVPYDPLAKPDPDITLAAHERQIGGLGIFMSKKIMDHMRYSRREGKNILTVTKKLG